MTSDSPAAFAVSTLAAKADLLRSLHHDGPILRLANAWDVASAVVIAAAGASAIATTSAGVAWSLGVPDGQQLGRERAADLIRRIAASVDVPVTADIEAGFGDDEEALRETIAAVLAAGAVGINIEDVAPHAEDRLRETSDQAARIAAVRAEAETAGIGLFINARVDTYLRGIGEPAGRLGDTAARAAAYLDAGADGIFVPGVVDAETIRALVTAIDAPLNILVGPGAPTAPELERLGVRRVSLGSKVAAAAYALAERAARELASTGGYETVSEEVPYDRLNALMGGSA